MTLDIHIKRLMEKLKKKKSKKVKPGGPSNIIIFNPDGSRRIVKCAEGPLLDVFGLTNAQKIEFLFEKDYPNSKALIHGELTTLFRTWINRKDFNMLYFKHGDLKG